MTHTEETWATSGSKRLFDRSGCTAIPVVTHQNDQPYRSAMDDKSSMTVADDPDPNAGS